MALQIWLLNPYQMHYNWTELCSEVAILLKPVVKLYDSDNKNKDKFGTVAVNNKFTKPPIAVKDLAIYVVPTPLYGFVGTDFGRSGHRKDAGGLTSPPSGGQSCCEAYVGDKEIVGTNGEFIRLFRSSRYCNYNINNNLRYIFLLGVRRLFIVWNPLRYL